MPEGRPLMPVEEPENANPLDIIERLAEQNDWPYERSEGEITLLCSSKWAEYQLSFTWMEDIATVHLACAFELKIPRGRLPEVKALIALINENVWVGHFDLWQDEGMIMFRHALLLAGAEGTSAQYKAMYEWSVGACDKFFPAFPLVVWAGKDAKEAHDLAIFETVGEA